MPRVVFGPWIGELGWELTSWQGWVRQVCQNEYKGYDKVVVSSPGREVLYGDILDDATFFPIPQWFQEIDYSARAYATDYWWKDAPKVKGDFNKIKNCSVHCLRLLDEIKEKFGEATYVVPWEQFKYKDALVGGVTNPKKNSHPRISPELIPFRHQSLKPLFSHPEMLNDEIDKQNIDASKPMVIFFPRSRERGGDRNWPKDYYQKMSDILIQDGITPCYIGTPGDAHFADDRSEGVLNLVRMDDESNRLSIQVAAMNKAVCAGGPVSGVIHVAMWAGLPCFTNGLKDKDGPFFSRTANPLKTRIAFFRGVPTFKQVKTGMLSLVKELI